MKKRHNKKRNTALIYEALLVEMTKSIVHSDSHKRSDILNIFRTHFQPDSILGKELQCYKAIMESSGLDQYTAEKIIFRAKAQHDSLNKDEIFAEQTKVIKKVNQNISPGTFSNFIPNYKSFATLSQIFSEKTPLKQRVLMEQKVINTLCTPTEQNTERMAPVDSLVVSKFTDRYNQQYASLLPEQKKLLSKYILGVGVNDVDFRITLGEELHRLSKEVQNSLSLEEVRSDVAMCEATKKVLCEIEKINVPTVGARELEKILKIQTLVNEYHTDAPQD
jgi:hypothetical protein